MKEKERIRKEHEKTKEKMRIMKEKSKLQRLSRRTQNFHGPSFARKSIRSGSKSRKSRTFQRSKKSTRMTVLEKNRQLQARARSKSIIDKDEFAVRSPTKVLFADEISE